MSKGFNPTDNNKPPVVVRDGVGKIVDTVSSLSWKFPIVDKEPLIALATVGLRVYGKITGEDVFVRNGSISLGFAPKDVALEIIEAASGKRANLQGNVISIAPNPNDIKNPEVWVELYLK